MKENEHGRLIAEIARAHLQPIGCRRKGRSRFWRSDQGFWLIGIEFQPSSGAKGTYLNIGACWLWDGHDHFSYDTDPYRVGHFETFETSQQFRPLVQQMARVAAEHVVQLRDRYRSIVEIADALEAKAQGARGWPVYHAAIAAGLAGHTAVARELFARLEAESVNYPYEQARRDAAKELSANLCDAARYRLLLLEKVRVARTSQRLLPLIGGLDADSFALLLFA